MCVAGHTVNNLSCGFLPTFLSRSIQIHRSHSSPSNSETISISSTTSSCDAAFCERFQIPTDEFLIDSMSSAGPSPHPLFTNHTCPCSDWQTGRRCSLLDNDKPLLGSKNGKLYLTQRFNKQIEAMAMPGCAHAKLQVCVCVCTCCPSFLWLST